MKYVLLTILFFIFGCTEKEPVTVQEPQGPTFVKIQAVDKDGKVQESEIILVR